MTNSFRENLYQFLEDHLKQTDHSPSFAEMTEAMGISPRSKSLITRSLRQLEKEGKLVLAKEGRRLLITLASKSVTVVEAFLMHMCEKLGARLRRHQFHAQHFFAGLLNYELGWLGGKGKSILPTNDSKDIFQLASFLLHQHWQGEPVSQIQVTALDPSDKGMQLDLLARPDERRGDLNQTMDEINDRYGEFTIAPAPMLYRSQMPNVIAPAWKPFGHRQTI
jgi:hypothetical protein